MGAADIADVEEATTTEVDVAVAVVAVTTAVVATIMAATMTATTGVDIRATMAATQLVLLGSHRELPPSCQAHSLGLRRLRTAFRRLPRAGCLLRASARQVHLRRARLVLRRRSSKRRDRLGWASSSQEARRQVMRVEMGMVVRTGIRTTEVDTEAADEMVTREEVVEEDAAVATRGTTPTMIVQGTIAAEVVVAGAAMAAETGKAGTTRTTTVGRKDLVKPCKI